MKLFPFKLQYLESVSLFRDPRKWRLEGWEVMDVQNGYMGLPVKEGAGCSLVL